MAWLEKVRTFILTFRGKITATLGEFKEAVFWCKLSTNGKWPIWLKALSDITNNSVWNISNLERRQIKEVIIIKQINAVDAFGTIISDVPMI